jgi:hypothetical protein
MLLNAVAGARKTALDFYARRFKSLKTRTLQKAKDAAPENSTSKARTPAGKK